MEWTAISHFTFVSHSLFLYFLGKIVLFKKKISHAEFFRRTS